MTSSRRMSKITDPEEFQVVVDERRRNRMAQFDGLDSSLRQLANEYGWTVVKSFLDLNIRKAAHIRHLVETVLNEFSPTRGANSLQGQSRAPGISADHPLNKR